MKLHPFVVLGIACLVSAALPLAYAGGDETKGGGQKPTYFLETKHTPEQCLKALDDVSAQPQLIGKFAWGCMAGDHTGYGFMEGTSESAVRGMMPKSLQAGARIVKVEKYTAEQVKAFHEKK